MEQSTAGFVKGDGSEALVDQGVVLLNDPTGEKCGLGTILALDNNTADFPHATVKWDSDGKVERVLLEDLANMPLNVENDFDLFEAEGRDYYNFPGV